MLPHVGNKELELVEHADRDLGLPFCPYLCRRGDICAYARRQHQAANGGGPPLNHGTRPSMAYVSLDLCENEDIYEWRKYS